MASEEKSFGGVDSTRSPKVKENPFLTNKLSSQSPYVRKRRKSRGLNAIGRGKISSIINKWQQRTDTKNHTDSPNKVNNPTPKPNPKQSPNPLPQPSQHKSELKSEPIIKPQIPSNVTNIASFNKANPPKSSQLLTEQKAELDRLKSSLTNRTQTNMSLQSQNQSFQQKISQLKLRNNSLNTTHNNLIQSADKLRKSIKELETNVLNQTKAIESKDSLEISHLKQQSSLLQNQLRNDANHTQTTVSDKETLINELKDKIARNETEMNTFNSAKDSEINKLVTNNENKSAEIIECKQKIESMTDNIAAQKEKITNLEQSMSAQNEQKQSEIVGREREIEECTQKMERITTEKGHKISELNASMANVDTELNEYSANIKALTAQNSALNDTNEQLIMQNMALTEKCNGMNDIRSKIQALEQENARLNREIAQEIQNKIAMAQVQIEEDYIPTNETEMDNKEYVDVESGNSHNPMDTDTKEYIDIESVNNDANTETVERKTMESVKSFDEFVDVTNEIFVNADGEEMKGWLEKQSKFLKKWKRTYVRVERKYFCVYEDESCNKFQCDRIDLLEMELIFSFDCETEFSLQNKSDSEDVHTFKCVDESESEKWMTYITEVEAEWEGKEDKDEFVSVKNEENMNGFVNVEASESTKEEKSAVLKPKKKRKKKVHKLAMGLNIPMGGLRGGPPPSLLKKKRDREKSGVHRELPQQEFEKPIIPSNVRAAKNRTDINPTLMSDEIHSENDNLQ